MKRQLNACVPTRFDGCASVSTCATGPRYESCTTSSADQCNNTKEKEKENRGKMITSDVVRLFITSAHQAHQIDRARLRSRRLKGEVS